MKGERIAATALVAVLALTGCSHTSAKPDTSATAAAASPSAPPVNAADPVTAFKASLVKTNQTQSTFTIDTDLGAMGSQQGTGAINPAAKATGYHADLTVSGQAVTVDAILVGSDLYLKVPGLTSDTRWSHVDMTKVKSLAKLGLDATGNPTNLASLPDEVVSVTRTGPGAYSGTLDRTKSPLLNGEASEALKSVPFEAKTDAEGRVTSLIIRTPPVGTAPASTSTIGFADFGKPITIARPDSAEVEQASDSLYQALQ